MKNLQKLLLKKEIFQQEIYRLNCQIKKLDRILPNHSIGNWDCDKSPIGNCIYDNYEDPCCDSCIYCGKPEERK